MFVCNVNLFIPKKLPAVEVLVVLLEGPVVVTACRALSNSPDLLLNPLLHSRIPDRRMSVWAYAK